MSFDHRAPFEAIGGEAVLHRLTNAFYDRMQELSPDVANMHETDENGRVSERARHVFWRFLCFWSGGPTDYVESYGPPRLPIRHGHLSIDEAARDGWLLAMNTALDDVIEDEEVRELLRARFTGIATFLKTAVTQAQRQGLQKKLEEATAHED